MGARAMIERVSSILQRTSKKPGYIRCPQLPIPADQSFLIELPISTRINYIPLLRKAEKRIRSYLLVLTSVTYTLQLPDQLPPTHRGKAFRFSYDLITSLTVALPGQVKRQKLKEILVPIRVWANVSGE